MTTPTPITEALKPCPMCGDQPIHNGRGNVGGLICTGIGSDPRYAHRVQAYGSTQAEAEAAWNTRATLKSPPIDLDPNGGAQEKMGRYELALSTIAKGKMVVERPWSAETAQAIAVECLQDVAALTPTGPARSEGREEELRHARELAVYLPKAAEEAEENGWAQWGADFRDAALLLERLSSLPPEPACSSGEGRARELLTCLLDNIEENGGYPAFDAVRGREFDAACRDALKFLYGVQTDA